VTAAGAERISGARRFSRRLRRAGGALAGGLREAVVTLAARRAPVAPALPADPGSIFVLRNNDIGDLLAVTPLFAALRRRFPAALIAAGIGDWSRDVLRGNPHVSEVVPVNAPWFNKYARGHRPAAPLGYVWFSDEARALAGRRFAVGIDVLGSAWGSLLLLRAGIPYRLGVRGYAGGHTAAQAAVEFDPMQHVGRAALRFAELLGAAAADLPECRPQLFLDAAEREAAERTWSGGAGARRLPRILVGPGGGVAARCWPPASFAALLGLIGAARAADVLVIGGPGEQELVAAVAAGAAKARRLAEVPSLRQVFALAAAADLVLCNSSMLLHAAAAFNRPTLVLLGVAFASARQHHAQWGYPGRCRSLGREAGTRERLYTPAEALPAVLEETAAWN
jgi:ADP-heptose:LPS heptosyltransferase